MKLITFINISEASNSSLWEVEIANNRVEYYFIDKRDPYLFKYELSRLIVGYSIGDYTIITLDITAKILEPKMREFIKGIHRFKWFVIVGEYLKWN